MIGRFDAHMTCRFSFDVAKNGCSMEMWPRNMIYLKSMLQWVLGHNSEVQRFAVDGECYGKEKKAEERGLSCEKISNHNTELYCSENWDVREQ